MNELLDAINKLNENVEQMINLQRNVYTTREAAEYLRISRDVLLRETRLGRIRCSKNGVNNLYQREDLLDWLESTRDFMETEAI